MRQRPDSTDYLSVSSGTSWANARQLLSNPDLISAGIADLGDTDYLYAGKAYWVDAGQHWALREMFLTITPTWSLQNEVDSASLRLYLAEDPDDDLSVILKVLSADYGTLDGNDWDAAGSESTHAIDISEDIVTEPVTGYHYVDLPLNATQLALLTSGQAAYFLVQQANEATEPTNVLWLKSYSATYATAALRPNLYLETVPQRQLITDALFDTLETITQYDRYNFDYATISRHWLTPDDLGETQCPVIMLSEDDDVREAGASATDVATMAVTFGVVVWNTDEDERRIDMNRAIDDIELCLDRNRKLGTDASEYLLRGALVSRVERDEEWHLDGCKQMAFVTVAIDYPRRHRG